MGKCEINKCLAFMLLLKCSRFPVAPRVIGNYTSCCQFSTSHCLAVRLLQAPWGIWYRRSKTTQRYYNFKQRLCISIPPSGWSLHILEIAFSILTTRARAHKCYIGKKSKINGGTSSIPHSCRMSFPRTCTICTFFFKQKEK